MRLDHIFFPSGSTPLATQLGVGHGRRDRVEHAATRCVNVVVKLPFAGCSVVRLRPSKFVPDFGETATKRASAESGRGIARDRRIMTVRARVSRRMCGSHSFFEIG